MHVCRLCGVSCAKMRPELGLSVFDLQALVEERSTLAFATKPVVGRTLKPCQSHTHVHLHKESGNRYVTRAH